jgi:5-methylcytosine-specific restriction endonuclease McrA
MATWRAAHAEERRTYRTAYNVAHAEERRAYSTAYRAAHPEEIRDYRTAHAEEERAWYVAHAEEVRTYQAVYYAAHSEKVGTRAAAYKAAHPEKNRAYKATRRARKAQSPVNDFTAAQWETMKAHYAHRCVYCGTKPHRLTQDHLTPLSKGGSHTMANIVPACQSCNSRKHTRNVPVPVQPLLL